MKRLLILPVLFMLVIGLTSQLAMAQTTGSVKGVCKDTEGNPIADGQVVWTGVETGHAYTLKTNKKGEYFSLGIVPGKYNVKLLGKDGKEIFHINGIGVSLDEFDLDFDMKKEQANQAQGQGMSPEQAKAQAAAQAAATKDRETVKSLNQKITDAKAASDAGDFDKAIATLNEANAIDPSRDLIWYKLADAYYASAPKQTDTEEKNKRYDTAATDYQKAIELRKASEQAAKDPNGNKTMAAYYNNLAQAYSKERKVDDAIAAYNQAAQLDPAGSGMYYFNEGAVYSNAGRADDAIVAFDKVIAIDPTKADNPADATKRQAAAYYQKGINLVGKATIGKDNKMVAPDGTAEAFQKYLELDPNGPNADTAKQMLASIGATVETGFGKKKAAKK